MTPTELAGPATVTGGPELAGTSAMTGADDGPNGRLPGDTRTRAERKAAKRTAGG